MHLFSLSKFCFGLVRINRKLHKKTTYLVFRKYNMIPLAQQNITVSLHAWKYLRLTTAVHIGKPKFWIN